MLVCGPAGGAGLSRACPFPFRESGHAMCFSVIDWLILSVTLSFIFFLREFARKYVLDMADYLVAGRSVGRCLGALTRLSIEMAILTFMHFAEMGHLYGFAAFIAGVIVFWGLYYTISGSVYRSFARSPVLEKVPFRSSQEAISGARFAAAGAQLDKPIIYSWEVNEDESTDNVERLSTRILLSGRLGLGAMGCLRGG
jgi:hypothetical protein